MLSVPSFGNFLHTFHEPSECLFPPPTPLSCPSNPYIVWQKDYNLETAKQLTIKPKHRFFVLFLTTCNISLSSGLLLVNNLFQDTTANDSLLIPHVAAFAFILYKQNIMKPQCACCCFNIFIKYPPTSLLSIL